MNELGKLVESIEEVVVDEDKFYNDVGKRRRKRIQEIKAMAQAVRVEVLKTTKNEE